MDTIQIMILFMMFAAAWTFSTVLYSHFLAKRPILTQIKTNPVIKNLDSLIAFSYYGVLTILALGLILFGIKNGSKTILLVSVLPIEFLLFNFLWGSRKRTTYADQLLILVTFLLLSIFIVPLGMLWVYY